MKKQIIIAIALWCCIVGISLYWNMIDEKRERKKVAFATGRAFFNQVVLTRSWNSLHGGVYVLVTKTSPPNIYLDDPLRDITANNDIKLTKINPAYMTRQIAEIAVKERGIQFHITSLKPIRPENKAAKWEKKWLLAFEQGDNEQGEFIVDGTNHVFRYMAPLFVKPSCLKCHAKQGYKEGDVRGGISVSIPDIFEESMTALSVSYGIAAAAGLVFILTGGVLLERKRQLLMISNEELKLEILERQKKEKLILKRNSELNEALSKVKLLSGFLPICASCKKIRDDKGYWNQIESYIRDHSMAEFSHGICPECAKKLYPEFYNKDKT